MTITSFTTMGCTCYCTMHECLWHAVSFKTNAGWDICIKWGPPQDKGLLRIIDGTCRRGTTLDVQQHIGGSGHDADSECCDPPAISCRRGPSPRVAEHKHSDALNTCFTVYESVCGVCASCVPVLCVPSKRQERGFIERRG